MHRRPLVRHLAACVVAAVALAAGVWHAEDLGWFDASAVPVSDVKAHAVLADVTRWDAATSSERRGVAELVARRLDGFTLIRVRPFGFEDHRHRIAIFRHEATNLEFSLIPGGSFEMGSPNGDPKRQGREGPQHTVTIQNPFLVCRTETTQAAWERVMGVNPSYVKAPDHPVELVSWVEARGFCRTTGLRLPTEAEWEWACRAGTTTQYWSGDSEQDLSRVAWYDANLDPMHSWVRRVLNRLGTSPPVPGHRRVAAKPANPFGLHDVHGNVAEWCEDTWHADYRGAPTDGTAWDSPTHWVNVTRGGDWIDPAGVARSASRGMSVPGSGLDFIGFRPAKSIWE